MTTQVRDWRTQEKTVVLRVPSYRQNPDLSHLN
jgi:hypothetical protein